MLDARRKALRLSLVAAVACCGCAAPKTPAVTVDWVVGQACPTFDPQGPPDPARWALERLLSRGLVAEDTTGRIVPAAAESVRVSPNGLVYTFTLRKGLAFADGHPCEAVDFRRALESGVTRRDHGTYAWLLGALTGMDKLRAGRPLPALGIATPDPALLVLRLSRPDPRFLDKLAFPGASVPWRPQGPGWGQGIGDYQIVEEAVGRMTLARRGQRAGEPDTIRVRFFPSAARVRAAMRADAADLVWPVPADLLDEALPAGYHAATRRARPARHLVLLQQADLPPTNRPAARHAFASGVNESDVLAALGEGGAPATDWLPGAGAYDVPVHDPEEVRGWLERGKLGRSLHVVMTYSVDGPGARIARGMQIEWARDGLDVELRAMRQPQVQEEWLRPGGSQLRLVESQALLETPEAAMAAWVQPMRGPAVGAARTGWTTREFDRWLAGQPMTADEVAGVRQRIVDERIVLPLAEIPWVWIARDGVKAAFHPRFGPDPEHTAPPPAAPSR